MNIKDVRMGDRCWYASEYPVEHSKTNCAVVSVDVPGCRVHVHMDSTGVLFWGIPGVTVFWRKPDAPPKPKREVERIEDGYVIGTTYYSFSPQFADVTIRLFGPRAPQMNSEPVRISWREFE